MTDMTIVAGPYAGMKHEDVIKQLMAENALLKAAPVRKTSLKVSEKGAVSLFGGNIRKFGATFYAAEWETILGQADVIRDFIKANAALVSRK